MIQSVCSTAAGSQRCQNSCILLHIFISKIIFLFQIPNGFPKSRFFLEPDIKPRRNIFRIHRCHGRKSRRIHIHTAAINDIVKFTVVLIKTGNRIFQISAGSLQHDLVSDPDPQKFFCICAKGSFLFTPGIIPFHRIFPDIGHVAFFHPVKGGIFSIDRIPFIPCCIEILIPGGI